MRQMLLSIVLVACGTVKNEPCTGDGCVCPLGLADCNGNPGDGCEADLASVTSCNACGRVCEAPAGATPACVDQGCVFACSNNLIACGSECVARCQRVFGAPGTTQYDTPGSCFKLRFKLWGAGGGNGQGNTDSAAGGFALVELAVKPGDSFAIVVGAAGATATNNAPGAGGEPGGGSGGNGANRRGGGGGGYSGVFLRSVAVDQAVAIAGGGGGSGGGIGNFPIAGAGGGLAGQDGQAPGGTQTTGFGALLGGPGAGGNNDGGGGGGGGWYGGRGGSAANSDAGGGGGGSGFAATYAVYQLLAPGTRKVPGSDVDPDRGTAGQPGMPGKIIVDCIL